MDSSSYFVSFLEEKERIEDFEHCVQGHSAVLQVIMSELETSRKDSCWSSIDQWHSTSKPRYTNLRGIYENPCSYMDTYWECPCLPP